MISSDEKIILQTLLIKIKMGKEQMKTTMMLRPKGGNYRVVLGALDMGTTVAAVTTHEAHGTTPVEIGYLTQDTNEGSSDDYNSLG